MAETIQDAARVVADASDADIFLYCGRIAEPLDDVFIKIAQTGHHRTNAILVLNTFGGSPDAAYRMARHLQRQYKTYTLLVERFCKSAGTLIAIGAETLVMSNTAEIGPIDVQVLDKEEIGEYSSGLTSMQALTMLQEESIRLFMQHFDRLHDPKVGFSTRLAARIAAQHTTGLFRAIYSQLDPSRLGENQRAMHIGIKYGERLARGRILEDVLTRLVAAYPSHAFVIDREECVEIFPAVREPTAAERVLLDRLAKEGKLSGAKVEAIFCEPKASEENVKTGESNEISNSARQIPQGRGSDHGKVAGAGGTEEAPIQGKPSPDSHGHKAHTQKAAR